MAEFEIQDNTQRLSFVDEPQAKARDEYDKAWNREAFGDKGMYSDGEPIQLGVYAREKKTSDHNDE